MAIYRKVGMAGATFVVAAAAGFVMQNGGALAERFGSGKSAVPAEPPVLAAAVPEGPKFAPPQIEEANVILSQAKDAAISARSTLPLKTGKEAALGVPQQPDRPNSYRVAALGDAPVLNAPELNGDQPTAQRQAQTDCSIALSVVPEAGAMVRLYLDAPCNRDQRVTIQQGALAYTAQTDGDGLLEQAIPALTTEPSFYAYFADKAGAKATAKVPDAADYERVALSWQGDAGLQLHAREFGADYGEAGHVWAQAPRTPSAAIRMQGGYLVSLGDADTLEPRQVEIYTFPREGVQKSGAVRISVEAEITAANCGRDVQGMSIQTGPNDRPTATQLTLAVPECDAVGDFLVLNSLLRDLKVARN